MIRGFARLKDETTTRIASFDDLRAAWASPDSVVWVDVQAPDEETLRQLDAVIDVDDAALDDCLHGEQRPRIDQFDDYLFVVSYGLLATNGEEFVPGKLATFVGGRFLITVHDDALPSIEAIIERCSRNPARLLADGADAIFFHIFDGMIDRYLLVTEDYETRLERLEDASLEPNVDESILSDAADLRRLLLELRRLSVSKRELVMPIARGECDYVSETLELRFRHVADHLSQVIDATDALRERLGGVRENYHSALARRANDTMRALTVLATIMLPMTLIAGIYGMNVPVWPPGDHPQSFWIVLGIMVIIGSALYLFFRGKRWL